MHFFEPTRRQTARVCFGVVDGEDLTFSDSVLISWGRSSHLGAASKRERRLLANALLEPDAHRWMAMATRATRATGSDGKSFRLLAKHLRRQDDSVADRLAAVLSVALSFEHLHRDLLYRFNQVLAAGDHLGRVRLTGIELSGRGSLVRRADALQRALAKHQDRLPRPVATAVHAFSLAVDPTVRARDDKELAINLIRHHDRVQAGKLDASRQPKHPWAETKGNQLEIAPRYALEDRPSEPDSNQLTHPYRIEQFTGMLHEAGGVGARFVNPRRLLETWEPPHGYRLASVVATTYELDADFLEEDLLPAALGLQLAPARGREFRLELEHALQDAEVSIFFHPGRYRPGLRRSPRIDLLALPEGRYPKLHAKIALLRFVAPTAPESENQIIRLLVGSANLTGAGYRSNIEVVASMDHAPGALAKVATAVRDAVDWLDDLIGSSTDQVTRQLRDVRAVLSTRPARRGERTGPLCRSSFQRRLSVSRGRRGQG